MKYLFRTLLGILILGIVFSLNSTKEENPRYGEKEISYSVFESNRDEGLEKSYGYEISLDGSVSIRQEFIPAFPGKKGFKSKSDAEHVAKLMIAKIENGNMPPSVSIEELSMLEISY